MNGKNDQKVKNVNEKVEKVNKRWVLGRFLVVVCVVTVLFVLYCLSTVQIVILCTGMDSDLNNVP